MKKAIAALAAVGALGAVIPATASAHATLCGYTNAEISTYTVGVSCATGWSVERYWFAHQFQSHYRFRIAGRTWTGGRDPHNPYVVNFTASGGRNVEVDLP
jgi:hypothetical protein